MFVRFLLRYGGFPISGEFLVCQNPEIVSKHPAKIYGKAAVGAPPMSVPHLGRRSFSYVVRRRDGRAVEHASSLDGKGR